MCRSSLPLLAIVIPSLPVATASALLVSSHGSYRVDAYPFSPSLFRVDGTLAIASSCPCSWLRMDQALRYDGELVGQLLLVAEGTCARACPPRYAACAAWTSNASGLILSHGYTIGGCGDTSGSGSEGGCYNLSFAAAVNGTDSSSSEVEELRRLVNASGCADFQLPTVGLDSNSSSLLWEAGTGLWWNRSSTLDVLNARSDGKGAIPARRPSIRDGPIHHPLGALLIPNDQIKLHLTQVFSLVELVNLTLLGADSPRVNCTNYRLVPIVYSVTTPIWGALALLWIVNTYLNLGNARELHRLLFWVPVVQFAHSFLSFLYFLSVSEHEMAAWIVRNLKLREPVLLLCLLLVAKGWCITRQSLERNEALATGVTLGLLYATVAAQLVMQSSMTTLPMAMAYLAVLYNVLYSISANLRELAT
ncbi:MAG: hypothetical protein SGPRY_000760 [Prymnesium sp.]